MEVHLQHAQVNLMSWRQNKSVCNSATFCKLPCTSGLKHLTKRKSQKVFDSIGTNNLNQHQSATISHKVSTGHGTLWLSPPNARCPQLTTLPEKVIAAKARLLALMWQTSPSPGRSRLQGLGMRPVDLCQADLIHVWDTIHCPWYLVNINNININPKHVHEFRDRNQA